MQSLREVIDSTAGFLQDANLILQVAEMQKYKVSGEYLQHLRRQFRPQLIRDQERESLRRSMTRATDKSLFLHEFTVFKGMQSIHRQPWEELIPLISCDKKWPICMMDPTQGNTC